MYRIIYTTDDLKSHEISSIELSEDQLAGIIICFYLNSNKNIIIYNSNNIVIDSSVYIRRFLLKEINGIKRTSFSNLSRRDISRIAQRIPSPTISFKLECSTYYPIVITSKYTILLHRPNSSLWIQFNDPGFLHGYIGALRWLAIPWQDDSYDCLSFLDSSGKEEYLTVK